MLLSLLLKLLKKLKGVKNDENSKSHNINKCIRIQGIPEDPNKTKGENLVATNDEVNDLPYWIGANARHGNAKTWENSK